MIVYLNGAFVEGERAISAEDRGLLLGHGAFETIYVADGACAFLDAHLDRLARGLAALGLAFDASHDWRDIARSLAERNGLGGRAALRLTVTGGPRGRVGDANASPTVLAALARIADPPPTYTIHLSRQVRCATSIASRWKLIGGYVDNLAAQAEARAGGADEAIMLNERGGVACASVANIFLIAPDGTVATPRLEDGALPGVVRALLLGGDHGIKIKERAILSVELADATLFMTNSLRGVAPCFGGESSADAGRALATLEAWYAAALASDLQKG